MNTKTDSIIKSTKPTRFSTEGITYEKTSETTVKVIKNFDNSYHGSIKIPATTIYNKTNYIVTEISENAFKGNENINSIIIGDNIRSIKAFTFSYCKNLSSIAIPNTVSSIGESAFSASGLTSFIFPSTVTTIENYLFLGCEKLITIIIPNTVTTIEEYAFGWCPRLTTLVCNVKSPLRIQSNVFFGTYINACTLEVPIKNLETYKKTTVWSSFKSIIASKIADTPN